jgi:translation initiation factor IF-3
MPERDNTRINDRIRVPEVRVIAEDGAQIGVMKTDEAIRYAQERDLDHVEVAAQAKPPVCRVLDYSKYKYEQAQKAKAAKKHQTTINVREIKFRPKIAEHDYATKKGHVERFLRHKDKVKVTIMFRGREITHPELGKKILDRLAVELEDFGTVEQYPNLEGKNMTMLFGPSKAILNGTIEKVLEEKARLAALAEQDLADEAAAAAVDGAGHAADADGDAGVPGAEAGAEADEPEGAAEPEETPADA